MEENMDIEIVKKNDITILNINEDLMSDNVDELRKILNKLFDEENYKMILNFEKVEFLSSQVLGAIAVILKKLREKKGDLKLLKLNKRVLRIFEVTRLTKIINIFDEENECIESFNIKE
jgi:anti-sigma B factor antagonist